MSGIVEDVGIQNSPVRQIQNFIFSPMGMITIGLVIVLYFLWKRKKLPDSFKPEEISKILKDRLNGTMEIIKETGIDYGTLRSGDKTIGKIKKHGVVKFEHPSKIKIKNKDTETLVIDELHLFEVRTGTGLFDMLFELLRLNIVLLIIPGPFVKRVSLEDGDNKTDFFNLTEQLDIISFGKIYFYGSASLLYLKGHAWLKGREDELEELVNYPKRAVYLDTRHTKHMEDLDKLYALDKARRESYMGSLMPGDKKKKS